jgi:hypothetical protein
MLGAIGLSGLLALAAAAQQMPVLRGSVSDTTTPTTPAEVDPQDAVDSQDTPSATDAAATRAAPLSAPAPPLDGARAAPDPDPFAPLGLRSGAAIIYPSVEQGIGWRRERGGEASVFSETTLRLGIELENDGHTANTEGALVWRRGIDGLEIDELEGTLAAALRLRLGSDHFAGLDLSYDAGPEAASSAVIIPDVVSQPVRQLFGATLSAGKDLGPLRYSIAARVERDVYGDADLSGGGTLSQAERDSTLYSVALRGGYSVSPSLAPFVEAEIGRRIHDERFDTAGFERSADRYGLRAGLAVDRGEKLSGELSVGWVTERPDDDRLEDISGLELASSLAWSPVRGTIVGLQAATAIESTTQAGDSGSVLYSGAVTYSREMRADLTADALFGIDWRDYAGSDDRDLTWRAAAGLTWWMNRYAGLVGRITYERQESTIADRDRDETGIYVGLVARR